MDNQKKVNRAEFFNKMMEERLKHSSNYTFYGLSPDEFSLVPNAVLEQLKDFDTWKEFKNDKDWIEKASKNFLVK